MSSNRQTFSRFHDAMNSGDAELVSKAIDEAVDLNLVFHAPVPGELTGEGDKVVYRNTVTGTHLGEYRGLPPTGKPITYKEIFRRPVRGR